MEKSKSSKGLTVKKLDNFSEWYTQVLQKAELVDIRLGVKGFRIIRPWGTLIIEKMYDFYEEELQKRGHQPTIMPSVIPEANLKKETTHIKGFIPEVFWLETEKGEEKLALRPTSETLYTPMFALWIRSWRDLPMKLYQRGSVFRFDTKATRPLIREREFNWIECHDAFATRDEAEKQTREDTEITENVMHQKFGIPFLPMKRPEWDRFAGAEYTIAADVLMPNGKIIQQPSTHYMGQKFSRAFGAKFKTKDGKEDYIYTTAYGPAISRILVSVIATHGDDNGLVLPFNLAPIQIVIIPIYTIKNKNKIISYARQIKAKLEKYRVHLDEREEYNPGWKFNEWELKGVPFRIEIGEKEVKSKKLTLFIRDNKKKQLISLRNSREIEKLGQEYDSRLKKRADEFMKDKIVNCKTKAEIKKTVDSGKIAKVDWCSVEKEGVQCAEIVEKDIGAEVRGTLANKIEKPTGNCVICNKKADVVAYIAKSY